MAFNNLFSRWAKLYGGTPAELSLEPHLARLGRVLRFQYPIWSFGIFPDFAFINEKVVVEVDGGEHRTKAGRAKDAERTAKLEGKGWRVWRCTNDECLRDPAAVVERLVRDHPELERIK